MNIVDVNFIRQIVKEAFDKFYNNIFDVQNKSAFDFVTNIDKNIEKYLIEKILIKYPNDKILAEESLSKTDIVDRVWTIDPIDGTVNMIHGLKLFGIQISLIINKEIYFSYISFPLLFEEYYAIKNGGCFNNNNRVNVNKEYDLNNSIISFGDYSHKDVKDAYLQNSLIFAISQKVSKIRMFGSAAMDLSCVSSSKTQGCVIITKNMWDLAPGILLCEEAGAIVSNLDGLDYKIGDKGLIIACNEEVKNLIVNELTGIQ